MVRAIRRSNRRLFTSENGMPQDGTSSHGITELHEVKWKNEAVDIT